MYFIFFLKLHFIIILQNPIYFLHLNKNLSKKKKK